MSSPCCPDVPACAVLCFGDTVRGLLVGFRTLFWAMILLFFQVYVMAVITAGTIGREMRVDIIREDEAFASVP